MRSWTGTAAIPACFYAQDQNRSSGIKVGWHGKMSPGTVVDVWGLVEESDGERYLNADRIAVHGTAAAPSALGVSGKEAAGETWGSSQR